METKKDFQDDPASKHEKSENAVNNSKKFEDMVSSYLASNPVISKNRKTSELEIRFGTSRNMKSITKIDYDNIIKHLYSAGFTTNDTDGIQILRIQNEYYDVRSETTKISNTRAEIVGIDLVQEYCKSNSIQKLLDMPSTITANGNKIKFTQKTPPIGQEGQMIKPVDFNDFNFRCSYQMEQDFTTDSNMSKNIIQKWTDSKKLFRYINRVRFAHNVFPIFVDVSIVKGSRKTGKIPIPQYTIQDAGVFQNQENYEIELEVDNSRVGVGTEFANVKSLMDVLRKCIRIVLGGLQGTNYPISYLEKERVIQDYMRLIHPKEKDGGKKYEERRVVTRDFIGPSSNTLQIKNIMQNTSAPTILENYTVTDKADGERKLLFVHENGRIYMIDTNMNVIFTGAITDEKKLHNSLFDGEHIKYDKNHKYVNLYASFDVYFVNGKSVRELAFAKSKESDETPENQFRLNILKQCMVLLNPKSIVSSEKMKSNACDFHIRCKNFQIANENFSIFDGCSVILSDIQQNIYEYNTDGLIFTPSNTGVNSYAVGKAGPITKSTWEESFKWKPPQYNTIDFLVSIKKDKNGRDEIHTIFQEGKSMEKNQGIVQYKTLILHCGFDKENHRFLNPFEDVINDNLPNQNYNNEERYTAAPFRPTNPYDPNACYCNILLENGQLRTEEHEVFEENMIVEFRYDLELNGSWKWVPLRVRYDKTTELRSGMKNYGNAYHVANSNWHSIHNPITEYMIMTGQGIPEFIEDEDVYYNRKEDGGFESSSRGMRDFHNLFVKKRLIKGVSQRKQTLIDFAVGKAGDLSKWINSRLSFVFGIDISRDNIMNSMDGACVRYLKSLKDKNTETKAIFLHGNSGLNIRSGKAFITDKDKIIARALFGNGPKERSTLKDGVYKQYGIGQDGFSIASCQFAIHYFFENNVVFHEFLRNISECTAVGGYFIGTCYDGNTVFQRLKNKRKEESITILRDDHKIYEITKMYEETGFPDDELSLGYMIHVYQDSINKTFPEYLVNFDYLVRMMENYGFVLINTEEASKCDLPHGSGMFSELFTMMENEIENNPRRRNDYGKALSMNSDEKWISFMNRYFVFRKVHSVDAEKIYKQFVSKEMINDYKKEEEKMAKKIEKEEEKEDPEQDVPKKEKPRKIGKKIVVDTISEPVENPKIVYGKTFVIKRQK